MQLKYNKHENGDYSLVEFVKGKWVVYAIRHQGVLLAKKGSSVTFPS